MRLTSSLKALLRRWGEADVVLVLATILCFALAQARFAEVRRLREEALLLRMQIIISHQRLEDMRALEERNKSADRQFRDILNYEISVLQAHLEAAPCRPTRESTPC